MNDIEIFHQLEKQFLSLTNIIPTLKIICIKHRSLEEKIIILENDIVIIQEQMANIMNFFVSKQRKPSFVIANQVQKLRQMRV